MAARVTVKVRVVGGSSAAADAQGAPWTLLRVSEGELRLPALRQLLAASLQISAASLTYLQYQDADGDWLTVCNDADILDGVDELGGSTLHLQALYRGARDAFRATPPALADAATPGAGLATDVPGRRGSSQPAQLASVVGRGDIQALAERGELAGAISLGERAVAAQIPLSTTIVNALLLACVRKPALSDGIAAFKLLKKGGLDPDGTSFNAIMQLGTQCGDLPLAAKALKACVKANCAITDVRTVGRLRAACTSSGVQVKEGLWKAAHRQLCLHSARLQAQGHKGFAQAELCFFPAEFDTQKWCRSRAGS